MKKIILVLLFIPSLLFAQEQISHLSVELEEPKSQESQEITSWTKKSILNLIAEYNKSLPVLNEELRKLNVGINLPKGAIFFMITGSCPTGTTDVSSTYSNKFVRINATAGSTGGADTDSITLTTNELPAHTHTFSTYGIDGAANYADASSGVSLEGTVTTSSTGSGNAFTVDTVPAYITMKCCQVD